MSKKKQGGGLVLAGPFPPPVHGFSAMNEAICLQARALGLSVEVLNLSPRLMSDQSGYSGARASAWMRAIVQYAWLSLRARPVRLYIGVSGGLGQLADLLLLLIARLSAQDIILHHHSFAYLNRKSVLTKFIVRTVGRSALHIVLCEAMGQRLREAYGNELHYLVMSNAALLAPIGAVLSPRAELGTIGMLSNLTLEKGVDAFIEIVRQLRSRGCLVQGRLAGPANGDAHAAIVAAIEEGLVTWGGPVYGLDKNAFFAGVDAFVLPTRYVNEAEPLVIHEALASGMPVIAADRGCIRSLVGQAGLVFDMGSGDLTAAVDLLETWRARPEDFGEACARARLRFDNISSHAQQARAMCLRRLADGVQLRSPNGVGGEPKRAGTATNL